MGLQPIDLVFMAGLGVVMLLAGWVRESVRERRRKAEHLDRERAKWEGWYQAQADVYYRHINMRSRN